MIVIHKQTKTEYILDLFKNTGEEKLLCPVCSSSRKKKTDKCLSWNHSKNLGHCFNGECSGDFYEKKEFNSMKKEYIKPTINNTELTDKAVEYFKQRGISQFTLRKLQVSSGVDWMPQFEKEVETIRFNYYRDSELVTIKYKGPTLIKDGKSYKSFKLFKDGELIFYNLDSIKGFKEIIICEGEIDCLSIFESGHHNVLSVPNGASNFEFIENCFDVLENAEKIILATDQDEAGIKLRNELIRRCGPEKCSIVDFKDCKDANEYHLKYGVSVLYECISNSKELPISGVTMVEDVFGNMLNTFDNGKRHGTTTHFTNFNENWKWRESEVNLWSGYANDGKTCFFNQLCVKKAQNDGWKFAIYSPENYPIDELYDELIHCYIGKTTDKKYHTHMSRDEYIQASDFINNHFFAIQPEDDNKLDTILSKMKYLVKKKGVKGCLIDPYNQIEHDFKSGEQEHMYVSRFMSKLKRFAVDYDVSMNLIAHQVTPDINGRTEYQKPNKYKIKGGGTFADKSDNVILVWRNKRHEDIMNTEVTVIVDKIKKQRLVGIPGECIFNYDFVKNQYSDGSDIIPDKKENVNYYEKEIQENYDFSDTQIEKESPF